MTLQIISIILLFVIVVLLVFVIIRQHILKKLQKQNQAIDYIIQRISNNVNPQKKEKLEELINIIDKRSN